MIKPNVLLFLDFGGGEIIIILLVILIILGPEKIPAAAGANGPQLRGANRLRENLSLLFRSDERSARAL